MDLLQKKLENYADKHSSFLELPVLNELERKTNLEVMYPQMLSGKVQGAFLSFLSQLQNPKNILEIGTYTGYSAICLALGLQEGGHLHTIEVNPEIIDIALEYFHKAGLNKKITLHQGDALTVLERLDVPWDLVFIDADKLYYKDYYACVLPKVKKGGLIIADNVLWKGMVLSGNEKRARALDDFNKMIYSDKQVKNLMLPFRDGLMIAKKI